MINLLPYEVKNQISYARKNAVLSRWITSILVGIVGVVGVIFAGQMYIDRSITAYESQINQAKSSLASQKLDETQKQIASLSSSLKLVVQVLSKEILFSKLIKQVGAVMPTGSSLQSLSINKVEGGIDLQAVASDYQTGTQVQINLQDPANKIFEKADILSINCSSAPTSDPRYPCQVSIRALFAKDSSFMFVKPVSGSTKK